MTISPRWHKPSCKSPQVVVDGNVPECRSCGSNASALLRRAAEEPAPSYGGINLPPEVPLGQMDLWWPPCVPYTRDGVPRARPVVSSGEDATPTPLSSVSSLSEIYASSLGTADFRLLYLSGAHDIDSPIHGDLVEYPRDNCPEYETTSYTWGGEDGDATPCRPAYFGEFWDVLFLTRNCWSLLQYLRPPMGTRAVWVDAVCINQNNIPERGAQVSSMPHIYKNCMRVVIFPGDHIVRREENRFRRRVRHDEIMQDNDADSVDDSRFDIWGSVLQGRYISRVWIIQELILAPHSILALKYHDLDLSNNLLYCISPKDNGRKWLEYMGQYHKMHQTTLIEGLRITSGNEATDPRDRIFGILGILGGNPTYSEIKPDYSISMRDCAIGAMGLTLLVSKEIWPLLHIQASDSTSIYPSWVPNLDELAVWANEAPPGPVPRDGDRPPGSIRSLPGSWETVVSLRYRRRSLGVHVQKVRSEVPWWQDASIDSGSGAITLKLVRMFDKPHKITRVERETWCGEALDEYHFSVEGPSAAAWFSSTKFPQKPDQPCHIFLAFHVEKATPRTRNPYLKSFHREPDICVIFATEALVPGTFNIVQCSPLYDAVCVSMSSPPPPQPSLEFWGLKQREGWGGRNGIMSLFETLHRTVNYNAREHSLPGRRYYQPDIDDFSHSWDKVHGRTSEAMLFDMIIPGKGDGASDFLQLSLSAARTIENPVMVAKDFRKVYANCLQTASAEFSPVVDDVYVWFTLADDDALSHYWNSLIKHISDVEHSRESGMGQWLPWDILFPSWFDLQIPEIGNTAFDEDNCKGGKIPVREPGMKEAEGRRVETPRFDRCTLHSDYKSQGKLSLKYWLPCSAEPKGLQMPVKVRMPLRDVLRAIYHTEINLLHRNLLAFSEKVSEDVETLLDRGPHPEDGSIYLQDWPESLVDELGFVMRRESVTFV